jgi:hypothetical protein
LDLITLSLIGILLLVDIAVVVMLLSYVYLFKKLKHQCMNGRSAKSMHLHLALIYLVVTLYLTNEMLDIFSSPLIFLIWDSDLYNAHIVSDYFHFIVVAVIDFILALALLYFFSKMSSAIKIQLKCRK